MTFNDDAKISGRGVRRSGRRTSLAVGGGGLGLVAIVLLSQLLGVNLSGFFDRADASQTEPTSDAVRLEVQADCFAGAWLDSATETMDENGNRLLEPITDAQMKDALNAASAIGDDRIDERTAGQVTPETWTHGSSEQRQKWFLTGYTEGSNGCDPFAASDAQL